MKNKHSKQGFTLIELLVVVLIIGILAAVALPQYQTAVEKSRTAEALTLLKHIQDAYTVQYLADPSINGESDPRDIVDLASGTWSNDGYSFCTKNFIYWFEHPDITAMRANSIEADCSDASDWLYAIREGVPDGSGYENYKVCSSYTDVGYKVCQGLVAQGFEPDDQRE